MVVPVRVDAVDGRGGKRLARGFGRGRQSEVGYVRGATEMFVFLEIVDIVEIVEIVRINWLDFAKRVFSG
jgi:hypothetical protein